MIAALLALVAVSLAATVAVQTACQQAQREREAQLLWVGNQFRMALRSYHDVNPEGGAQQYPQALEDLLEDTRGAVVRRHLRRIYPDPITSKVDWVLEREGGRIVGVHSSSTVAPLRRIFQGANAAFATAKTYADWRFLGTDTVEYAAAAAALGAPTASAALQQDNSNPTEPAAPPPDPQAVARAQCYAQYGVLSVLCRGPSYPVGSDAASCRAAEVSLLDQCLAAAASAQ